jgi:hypothetical protein
MMYKFYISMPGLSVPALRSRCLLYILTAAQTPERSYT